MNKFKIMKTIKSIIIVLVVLLFSSNVFSQLKMTSNDAPTIMELSKFINELKSTENTMKGEYSNVKSLENLLYDVQPSLYFYDGDVKSYGNNQTTLFTDCKSFNRISENKLDATSIEIIRININDRNDLNTILNSNEFKNFKKLKYIYFTSSFDINENDIIKVLNNPDLEYSIFYSIYKKDTKSQKR